MIALLAALFSITALSQTPQLLTRTTTKTDKFAFGSGGTIAITGAPSGSIRVFGTLKNEIEITAVIEVQAGNEADLARLAEITGFATDESPGRTAILSVGTHNKLGLSKLPKKFPKTLLGLPFRIDYSISVPYYCDLEIDGGKGDLSIKTVEGTMQINFIETNAKVEVISGPMIAMIGSGSADVSFGTRGWRGRASSIQIATGDLTVRLPSSTSAEVNAAVLKSGKIENLLPALKPLDRKIPFTDKLISAKAGVGGAALKFTVGDGTLKMFLLQLPL